VFLFRLLLLRRGGTWNSQTRESHAVPWRLACEKLWLQTLAGFTVIAVVAIKTPNDIGYALMGGAGLALSIPLAVATASPWVGTLLARIGVGRIPEEIEPPIMLLPLRLPAIAASAPVDAEPALATAP
jgi:membrane glycosyltransferase